MAYKKKSALVLDFDGTIWDTAEMDQIFLGVVSKYGISELDYQRAYKEARQRYGSNDLSNHVNCMVSVACGESAVSEVLAGAILDDLLKNIDEHAPSLIFPDARVLIDRAESLDGDIDMFILSRGHYFFQMRKITATGITGKFKRVFIARTKKHQFLREIAGNYRKLCFCDNSHEEIMHAWTNIRSSDIPILVRWIDRNDEKDKRMFMDRYLLGPVETLHIDWATGLTDTVINFLLDDHEK